MNVEFEPQRISISFEEGNSLSTKLCNTLKKVSSDSARYETSSKIKTNPVLLSRWVKKTDNADANEVKGGISAEPKEVFPMEAEKFTRLNCLSFVA